MQHLSTDQSLDTQHTSVANPIATQAVGKARLCIQSFQSKAHRCESQMLNQEHFRRSKVAFCYSASPVQIVGKASPWIQPDSKNEVLRRDSEAALRQELEWAAHLSLQACILPLPPSMHNSNYARILVQVAPLCQSELFGSGPMLPIRRACLTSKISGMWCGLCN